MNVLIPEEVTLEIGKFLEQMLKQKHAVLVLTLSPNPDCPPICSSNFTNDLDERIAFLRGWLEFLENARDNGNVVKADLPRVQ